MSDEYTPTMLLTLYYLDDENKKKEVFFEFNKEQLHEFVEKLQTVRDVCFFLLNTFIITLFSCLIY